jgi:hypothetical protein
MQFLQGGGQLSDYRFTSGPYAGMTVSEVRGLMNNFGSQVQSNFGPKKPDTMTGSNSGDQAAGLVAGVGLPLAAGAAYNYFSAPAAAAATGTTTGASTLGSLSLSNALGLGGSSAATTAGTAGTAGAGTAGTAASGAGAAGLAGLAIPAAVAVGAGLAGKGIYDAAKGKDIPWYSQSVLGPMTGGLSLLYNPVKSLFGSKRKGEALARKEGRLGLQNAGLMNADSRSKYNLAGGSQFDIREFKKNTGKDAYNVDWSGENANRGDQVGLTNALANALIGGKGGVRSAMAGELYNAYNSDGNFDANIKGAYDKAGGREAVYGSVAERWKKGELTAQERDANFAAIDKLYGIKNTSNARWENSQNLSQKDKDRNTQELANSVQPATKAPAQATNNSTPQANMATNKPPLIKGPPKDGGAMLKNKRRK